jgi:hypothetical protein
VFGIQDLVSEIIHSGSVQQKKVCAVTLHRIIRSRVCIMSKYSDVEKENQSLDSDGFTHFEPCLIRKIGRWTAVCLYVQMYVSIASERLDIFHSYSMLKSLFHHKLLPCTCIYVHPSSKNRDYSIGSRKAKS